MSQKRSRKKKIGDNEPVRVQLQGHTSGRSEVGAEGSSLALDCPECGSGQYFPNAGLNDIHVCRECGLVIDEKNVQNLRRRNAELSETVSKLGKSLTLAGNALNSARDEFRRELDRKMLSDISKRSLSLFSVKSIEGNR